MSLVAIDQDAFERSMKELRDEIARMNRRLDAVRMMPRDEWLTVTDYAKHVGRTKRTVRNWINSGTVETKREGEVTFVRVNQA